MLRHKGIRVAENHVFIITSTHTKFTPQKIIYTYAATIMGIAQ